jgi:predicted regulator of Ras-like GTPase activity (Roadblock/LC7/MglB family)
MATDDPKRNLSRALVFYPEDVAKLDRALAAYRESSRSQGNLLIDLDGHLVTQTGSFEDLDLDTVAALVAGSFKATREIARALGEEEFTSMSHQGKDECIHLALVGERTILATIYSPQTTTAGLVSFYVASVLATVRAVIDSARGRVGPVLEPGFGQDIQGSFDILFGEG